MLVSHATETQRNIIYTKGRVQFLYNYIYYVKSLRFFLRERGFSYLIISGGDSVITSIGALPPVNILSLAIRMIDKYFTILHAEYSARLECQIKSENLVNSNAC